MKGVLSYCRARDERVDWLYRGPSTTNREEYLLGKRIDKSIDPTLIEDEREKEVSQHYYYILYLVMINDRL